MGYIPKFIHLDKFISVKYPFGLHWNQQYIRGCARAIYDTFKTRLQEGDIIAFVVRGSSGAIIAGAIKNEIYHFDNNIAIIIVISRKVDEECHSVTLSGLHADIIIVIDDFIESGDTISNILQDLDTHIKEHPIKYDMLCISNWIEPIILKKNGPNENWETYKAICSRFKYVACCPRPEEMKNIKI